MCQMAVPKFVTFCAIVPPAPRGRLRPLSIQLSNWIWKFSLGKRHPPKYMSNRKEILFKGKEILLTDMTKFSLPVDVSALTHRPAVGRNANTLKKRQWRWDLKNNTFCSLDIFKRGISYCFNAFLQFLLSFLQSFEIFHNSFIVISERKVLHDIALILFTFSLPAMFFLLTLFLQGLWRWQKSSLVCRTPCKWSWWRRTYVVIIFYCMYDLIQLD